MKKECPVKNITNGGAAFSFGLLLSVFLLSTSTANAQQNYWMARQADTTYVFDQQVPQSFGDAIAQPNSSQFQVVWDPQNFDPQTVGGTTYRFIKVSITSDYEMFENQLPKRSVSMKSKDGSGGHPQSWIEMSSSDPLLKAFASQLPSREMGKWFSADLIICVSPSGDQPPSVRMTPGAIHEQQLKQQLKQHEQIMGQLAENISLGTYFPSVKKPADLLAFQQEMLRYGNLGRRDPDFRKLMGSTTATNLEGDSVQTQNGPQKVFKTSSTAPYFRDHVLREDLNNAAQLQAEYQATIGQTTHDGPGSYVLNGKNLIMSSVGQRIEAFLGTPSASWEACASGLPGTAPYVWMKSETHFRPWFNVDDLHREVGYGAAQAANGMWYYAAVGIPKKTDDASGFPEGYFYLTTKSGENEKLVLESAPAVTLLPNGNYTGMWWKATPAENADGYFYLTSQYLAEKNLVLESSDGNNSAVMVPNEMYSGTLWKLVPADDGYFYLTSAFMEPQNKVLNGNVGQDAGATATFQGAPYMVEKNSAGPGALWKFVPIPSE